MSDWTAATGLSRPWKFPAAAGACAIAKSLTFR